MTTASSALIAAPAATRSWHVRLSLAALDAMLILPFLSAHHYQPIPTFYQELSAAALGILAATILLRKTLLERLVLPGMALLPLGLLGILLLQLGFGLIVFPTQALLFALYLLWALLLLALGRSLREEIGLEPLVARFAAAIVCGTMAATVVLALQLTDAGLPAAWIFPVARGSGNLGQTNHLANYLWLGVCSAICLRVQGRLGGAIFALCVVVQIAAASLTGSRSVILYAVGLAALSAWGAWHFRQPPLRRVARLALGVLLATLFMQWAFAHFDYAAALRAPLSGERFFAGVSGSSQRLQLWRTGLTIFLEHPWLGAGVGQFPFNAYLLMGAHPSSADMLVGEHAHNLLVDLLCEFGPIAVVLVLVLGLRWWMGFVRQSWSAAHWWIAAVLLVLSTHSQLEYPLWYAFFLGIAALALGAGSAGGVRPHAGSVGRLLLTGIVLLGALTLFTLASDYRRLEGAFNMRINGKSGVRAVPDALAALGELHRGSLFAHYVEMGYAELLVIDRQALKDKIVVTERAIRFAPAELISFKLAYLLALDEQHEAALIALRRAAASHPTFVATAIKQLELLSPDYPQLEPLRAALRPTVPAPNAASARQASPVRQ